MATGLCEKCAQLLTDFVAYVKRLPSELVQKIKECIKNLSRCSCLRRKRATVASYISEQHERQAARTLLNHLDTGIGILNGCVVARTSRIKVLTTLINPVLSTGIKYIGASGNHGSASQEVCGTLIREDGSW